MKKKIAKKIARELSDAEHARTAVNRILIQCDVSINGQYADELRPYMEAAFFAGAAFAYGNASMIIKTDKEDA